MRHALTTVMLVPMIAALRAVFHIAASVGQTVPIRTFLSMPAFRRDMALEASFDGHFFLDMP